MYRDPEQLTILAHNVKVGRSPRSVVASVRAAITDDTDVVILTEAAGYTRALRESLTSWQVRHAHGWPEARNVVLLVRRDLRVHRFRAIRNLRSWVGPKLGRRHAGRTFPVVDLGTHWRIVGVHRTSGGPNGPNAEAWAEEHRRLARLARRTKRRALVIVGDQNCQADDPHPLGLLGLARAIGGDVIATHTKVDHAVVRGVDGRGRRGDYHGSDHPAVRYTLTLKES